MVLVDAILDLTGPHCAPTDLVGVGSGPEAATRLAQLAPWLQIQPYAEYVFNLNGGVANPQVPTKRLGDAAVLALRTTITF